MMGLGEQLRRAVRQAGIKEEERRLAGQVTGGVFLLGAVTLAVVTFLPGIPREHRALMLAVAGSAAVLGALSLTVVPWQRAAEALAHPLQWTGLAAVALAVYGTGGGGSPAWPYLLLSGLFAAYFYRRPMAMVYLLACVLVQALPLLYDSHLSREHFVATLVVAAPVYVSVGLGINTVKRHGWRLRARAETLAAEQGALRRVATAVVGGQPSERIYEMVARELAGLLNCGGAGIMRIESDDALVVVGAYGEREGGVYRTGTVVPVRAGSDVGRALASRRPVRIDQHPDDAPVRSLGYQSSVVAPVSVGGRLWGLLAAAAAESRAFGSEDEQTLLEFGDLLATAIASAEEHTRLAEQALTDPLTGLANQRALHARLTAELARAARHDNPLAVAVIDIDHFKEINDTAGHETGDEMLVRVAAALASFARVEDTLGRIGGDEFAWVLPDTTREQALVAVERARRLLAAAPPDPYRITISAGICDSDSTTEPSELIRLADSALYWSKAHGRNQSWIYDPAVVDELSEQERAQRLERSQALSGLRALVRSLESRDPATREHSERTAALAGRLAARVGWARDRALLLTEAALLHDIGRVGRADGPARLVAPISEEALEQLRAGAQASARIVEGLLPSEQVAWIGGQLAPVEPDGGRVESSAEGASLLAAADLWDRLTAITPGLPVDALAECQRLAGRCLSQRAVHALRALHEAGELAVGGATAGERLGADE